MDVDYRREPQPWEQSDGYVHNLREAHLHFTHRKSTQSRFLQQMHLLIKGARFGKTAVCGWAAGYVGKVGNSPAFSPPQSLVTDFMATGSYNLGFLWIF